MSEDQNPTPNQHEIPTPPKPSLLFQTILTFSLLFLVFITSLLIAYQSQKKNAANPTPTPPTTNTDTSNWKTYKNEEFGYLVKYPPDYYILESDTNAYESNIIHFSKNKPPISINQENWVISINVSENQSNQSVDEIVKDITDQYDIELNLDIDKIIIAGVQGEIVTGLPARLETMDVVVTHNNYVYYLSLDPYVPNYPFTKESVKIFNQILSTFQFIDADEKDQSPPDSSTKPALDCITTGCNGEICADEEKLSTCLNLPGYACYKDATCERQKDEECGWTQTEKLKSCLENSKNLLQ